MMCVLICEERKKTKNKLIGVFRGRHQEMAADVRMKGGGRVVCFV